MSSDTTNEELRAALRDERAERESAQRRAAQLAENVALWRKRAEDRRARIQRLEAERDQLRSVRGWLRSRAGNTRAPEDRAGTAKKSPPAPDAPSAGARAYRAYASTLVGAIGVEDPVVRNVLGQFNCVDFEDDPGILDRADLLIWDPSTGQLAPDRQERLDIWRTSGASGARLLLLAEPDHHDAPTGARVIRGDRQWLSSFDDEASDWVIPTTFDAAAWNPAMKIGSTEIAILDSTVELADDGEFGCAVRHARDWSVPWVVALSAAGVPFDPDGAMKPEELQRNAVAGRREAFRTRAPWVVASDLLDRFDVDHRSSLPSVAAVVVSNRPSALPNAIRAIARQTYPNVELVVGCHGFDPKDGEEQISEALADLPARFAPRLMSFRPQWTLGRCLNAAISSTDAVVIAKMDDDDHYGPGYLEDAVQAMLYSGGSLVAKGSMFTYLESTDATILRRPKTAEQFYSGSPNGASMVFARNLWEQVRFPDRTLGEDVAFGAGAALVGVRPYATSPWEFVYRRAVTGNTWKAVDEVFLEGSAMAWPGDHPSNAEITGS
ncbi:MAG: glycosyltransferase [Acidimicrobiia bacterium]